MTQTEALLSTRVYGSYLDHLAVSSHIKQPQRYESVQGKHTAEPSNSELDRMMAIGNY